MRIPKLTLALSLLSAASLSAGITLKEEGRNLKVMVDGKLFTEVHGETRVPCLYPLMSPSGTHLTRQHPFVEGVPGEKSDHPHHTGFWFTHGNVNGHDFWHKDDCRIVTRNVAVVAAGK
ncbi:MAG: PmoA family protein, partial [Roseibacillus sp.]|nr:PmoA family protein [Roseibacillus sp.]